MPTRCSKESQEGQGYLGTWVTAFNEFSTDTEENTFFYARYGYAIETLATGMFLAEGHAPYKVATQVTQGSTRPDFVIRDNTDTEVAWLDVTSADSQGHIHAKQGGGGRPGPTWPRSSTTCRRRPTLLPRPRAR